MFKWFWTILSLGAPEMWQLRIQINLISSRVEVLDRRVRNLVFHDNGAIPAHIFNFIIIMSIPCRLRQDVQPGL